MAGSLLKMTKSNGTMDEGRERLRQIIQKKSIMKGRSFLLASGQRSNYFLDLKPTMLDPEGINLLADVVLDRIENIKADCIGGLVMGAVPVIIATVLKSHSRKRPIKGFWVRKEQKDHGAMNLTDGHIADGQPVIIVDDVTTTGGSVMKAVEEVKRHNCSIAAVITVVDRLEGARELLVGKHGLNFIALFDTKDFDVG